MKLLFWDVETVPFFTSIAEALNTILDIGQKQDVDSEGRGEEKSPKSRVATAKTAIRESTYDTAVQAEELQNHKAVP
jgi:hypothetical protein